MLDLEHLLTATIELAPIKDIGHTPVGHRRIIDITGGVFEGERIKGKVLAGGADWQIIRGDGSTYLDTRYTLETDDGALIYITNPGYRHGPPEVIAKLMAGEKVDPASYYFRSTPWFETSAPRYDWLNKTIFVAAGEREKAAVKLHIYEVK